MKLSLFLQEVKGFKVKSQEVYLGSNICVSLNLISVIWSKQKKIGEPEIFWTFKSIFPTEASYMLCSLWILYNLDICNAVIRDQNNWM